MNTSPIGILGGAFDPIHLGHLRTALEVLEKFSLESIHFVPCRVPVHKSPTVVNTEHRINMVKLAIINESRFYLDDREVQRESPSYMVETLCSLREEMGNDKPLALIVGADALAGFTEWHEWEKIFDLAHIIAVSREGQKIRLPVQLRKFLNARKDNYFKTMSNAKNGLIFFHHVTRLDISSTNIRAMITKKQSPRYLLPEQVWQYIQTHNLYVA